MGLVDPPVHLHPSQLSVPPEEHLRTYFFTHSQPLRVDPEGHLELTVPVHLAEYGVSVLPDGHLAMVIILHDVHALFKLKLEGHVGLVICSQAHRPWCTTFLKPDGQVES